MIEHKAILNGEIWTIRLGNFPHLLTEEGEQASALCEWRPTQRLIRVHEDQTEADILECLIHEMIHARCPWMTEEAVTDMAHEMTTVLINFEYERGDT